MRDGPHFAKARRDKKSEHHQWHTGKQPSKHLDNKVVNKQECSRRTDSLQVFSCCQGRWGGKIRFIALAGSHGVGGPIAHGCIRRTLLTQLESGPAETQAKITVEKVNSRRSPAERRSTKSSFCVGSLPETRIRSPRNYGAT